MYCGKKWETSLYFSPKDKQIRCIVCNDPNIKYKTVDQIKKDADVFGYNVGTDKE